MKQLQDDPTGTLQALALEMGPTISLGTACGFASGFALKKAGKVAIVVRRLPLLAARALRCGARKLDSDRKEQAQKLQLVLHSFHVSHQNCAGGRHGEEEEAKQ